MNHKASCLKQKELAKEYEKLWPNYCKKCHGTGELSWQENQSPLGSGLYWPETITEFCEECTGQGLCPHCGKPFPAIMELEDLWDDDSWRENKHGPHCNWNFNSAGAPEQDCYCWEDWED